MTGTRGASLKALRQHPVPSWWTDAKLGIMVHWTLASVPAFAPTDGEIGELLASSDLDALKDVPYVEWYENSLRFDDSQVSRHHRATYGDRPYAAFADDFDAPSTRHPNARSPDPHPGSRMRPVSDPQTRRVKHPDLR